MRMRTAILLVVVSIAIFLLTGCGGKGKEPIDVTFMYWADSPQASAQFTEWLKEYQKEAQQKVEELYAPFGEGYQQKLLILIGAKQAPDLFMLSPEYLSTFQQKGALLPLDTFVKESGMAAPDSEKYPYVYGSDGQIYGIPVNDHTTFVIFSLTEKAQTSWDLLKFLLKKMKLF